MLAPAAQAANVLSQAFESDPLFTYLLPQAQARGLVTRSFFRVAADYSVKYGEMDLTPDGHGAACWLRPNHTIPTMARLLPLALPHRRLWRAMFTLGLAGLRRFSALITYADKLHRQAAPGKHWLLWVVGVEPQYQRQGIGSWLLQTGLARAEADRLPCYLETNNVLNVIFYQKHGFKVVTRNQPTGHELTYWTMRRDPA
jgi:ribosomal protein S18 acetylase RimI-like enzyme